MDIDTFIKNCNEFQILVRDKQKILEQINPELWGLRHFDHFFINNDILEIHGDDANCYCCSVPKQLDIPVEWLRSSQFEQIAQNYSEEYQKFKKDKKQKELEELERKKEELERKKLAELLQKYPDSK